MKKLLPFLKEKLESIQLTINKLLIGFLLITTILIIWYKLPGDSIVVKLFFSMLFIRIYYVEILKKT